jgi:hypothetical protein
MMSEERLDLTALELNAAQRELLVAAILARADAELARRASNEVSPMLVLSAWARPALAAAAVLALVCATVLARNGGRPAPVVADALAVPAPADAWLVSERGPTLDDLLVAMESEGQ